MTLELVCLVRSKGRRPASGLVATRPEPPSSSSRLGFGLGYGGGQPVAKQKRLARKDLCEDVTGIKGRPAGWPWTRTHTYRRTAGSTEYCGFGVGATNESVKHTGKGDAMIRFYPGSAHHMHVLLKLLHAASLLLLAGRTEGEGHSHTDSVTGRTIHPFLSPFFLFLAFTTGPLVTFVEM